MEALVVKWKSFLVMVENEGNTRAARFHEIGMIPGGSKVQIVTNHREKIFGRGKRVSFTGDEFAEIAHTYRSFGDHVHEKLVELVRHEVSGGS